MRVHRPLALAAAELLAEVFDEGQVLDRVMARAFRVNRRWGKRDRAFVAESVWEVARWCRALEWVTQSDDVKAWLAAVWCRAGYEVPDWWTWSGGVSAGEFAGREAMLGNQPRAVRESVPDWLDERGARELGARWDEVLASLNTRAPVFLRANRLLAERGEVIEWLAGEGVKAEEVDGLADGLVLDGVLPRRLARDGRIAIQDGGSQRVVPMMGVKPGMRVIDACAGAGGKTLHLAAELGGCGELVAMDVHEGKLRGLEKRAVRAGVEGLRVEMWSDETEEKWRAWADRVLVDAPCSGLGTLRRQPDLKWRLSVEQVEAVRATQQEVLGKAAMLVRSGGCLTYATCSVLASENRGQVADFLSNHPHWRLMAEEVIETTAGGFDGFYLATLSPTAEQAEV